MYDLSHLRPAMWSEITFAHPLWFLAFLILPIILIVYFKRKKTKPTIQFPSVAVFKELNKSALVRLMHIPFILRCLAISLAIIALARPQSKLSWQDMSVDGIDIVLAMDLSPSMFAKDLKPNRMEASKQVALNFIDRRPADRIGLVVFSGEAYTLCPLTIDHSVLKNLLLATDPEMLPDGTAIGMGLATSANRLRDSKAKSKIVILLTDGENNSGNIAPITAAEIAQLLGIRVYTIGVGTRGKAYSPVSRYPNGSYAYDYVDVKIDEPLMQRVAEMTNGKYFRATNNEALEKIYNEIDLLEKTKFDVTEFRKKKEEFWPFALGALLLFVAEWFLRNTLMRSIP